MVIQLHWATLVQSCVVSIAAEVRSTFLASASAANFPPSANEGYLDLFSWSENSAPLRTIPIEARCNAGAEVVPGPKNSRYQAWHKTLALSAVLNVRCAYLLVMSFKLPDLPYGYDALEPSVDAQTMQVS